MISADEMKEKKRKKKGPTKLDEACKQYIWEFMKKRSEDSGKMRPLKGTFYHSFHFFFIFLVFCVRSTY
jgi:hypothetical protein